MVYYNINEIPTKVADKWSLVIVESKMTKLHDWYALKT